MVSLENSQKFQDICVKEIFSLNSKCFNALTDHHPVVVVVS
jgi:hypothetical protein